MFRFIIAGLLTVMLLGGVALTQRQMTRQVDFRITREIEHDETVDRDYERFYFKITPTCDLGRDPFAISYDDETGSRRIAITSGGDMLFNHRDDVAGGTVVSSPAFDMSGTNAAFLIEATPSPQASLSACAIRVRLYTVETDALCDEVTLWSEGQGGIVQREMRLRLEPKLQKLDRGL